VRFELPPNRGGRWTSLISWLRPKAQVRRGVMNDLQLHISVNGYYLCFWADESVRKPAEAILQNAEENNLVSDPFPTPWAINRFHDVHDVICPPDCSPTCSFTYPMSLLMSARWMEDDSLQDCTLRILLPPRCVNDSPGDATQSATMLTGCYY